MMCANENGILKAIVPIKIIKKRGITIKAVTDDNKAIIAFCTDLHSYYGVAGYYNIQLIVDLESNIYVIEINPRISTTACLGFASGVNFINCFLEKSNNIKRAPFKSGVLLNRHWSNFDY